MLGSFHHFRDFCDDLTAEYALTGHDRVQGRGNSLNILFDQITLGTDTQGTDNIFIVGKCGQKKNPGIRMLFQNLGACVQSGEASHLDIHEQNIGKHFFIQADGFLSAVS